MGLRKCFLCGRNGAEDPLDRHHVFFGANRKKSEEHKAVVLLCHNRCHIFGKNSVHQNAEVCRRLQAEVQQRLMKKNGWTIDDFIGIFGKNYL